MDCESILGYVALVREEKSARGAGKLTCFRGRPAR